MKKYAGKNTINFLTKLFGNEVLLLRNEIDELKERVSTLENNSGSGGAHTHEFVDGICTVCGIDIGELANWAYQLNETDKSIILTNYIGSESDVIVRSSYAIGEDIYNTTTIGICLFKDCTSVQTITFEEGIEIVSYNGFSTNNMFSGCTSLTTINGLENIDMSNVSDMSYMFSDCSSLTSLDITGWNTSKVTNMSSMFSGCSSLTTINGLENFDTSNVTNMSYMFCICSALTTLDLTSFDTSNVTTMSAMFYGCSSLTSLDLTSFDTSNVTNMGSMFYECSSLTSLDVTSFDTSKVISMGSMFYGCSSLTSLDVTSFDTSNVMYMSNIFYSCSVLTEIKVTTGKWVIVDGCSTTDMFYDCGVSEVTYVAA